jgi:type IV secretory pathway component VirB8
MQPVDRKADLEDLLHELDDKSDMTHNSINRPGQSELSSIKIGHSSSRNHSREMAKTKVSTLNYNFVMRELLTKLLSNNRGYRF